MKISKKDTGVANERQGDTGNAGKDRKIQNKYREI
jgi:hypothetical protein